MKKILLLVSALTIVLLSCKKDPPIYPEPVKPVTPPPPVSYAGKYILFDEDESLNLGYSNTFSHTSIYYTLLDGSSKKRITNALAGSADDKASVSPDGKKIVFTRTVIANNEKSLYTINLDGTGLALVTKGLGADKANFDPDGKRLSYIKTANGGGYDVYVCNVDGTGEKRLTTFAASSGSVGTPTWANDGRIYFNATTGAEGGAFYSIKPDGTDQQVVYGGIVAAFAISPDMQLVLSGRDYNLFVSQMDGTNLVNITNYSDGQAFSLKGASFTKDQKQIFFASDNENANLVGIFKVNVDGTGTTKILSGRYGSPVVF